jgi:hypothetical protein
MQAWVRSTAPMLAPLSRPERSLSAHRQLSSSTQTMASPKSAEDRAAAKAAKKQAKAEKRAKREGTLPSGSKDCTVCGAAKDMLIRNASCMSRGRALASSAHRLARSSWHDVRLQQSNPCSVPATTTTQPAHLCWVRSAPLPCRGVTSACTHREPGPPGVDRLGWTACPPAGSRSMKRSSGTCLHQVLAGRERRCRGRRR